MPDLPPDGAPHEPWLAGRPEGEGCAMRELEGQRVPTNVDLDSPPPGAKFYGTNSAWVLTASTRSWQALTWIPFAAFWNGAVWFGLYGQQIATGNYSLLLSLIGLPFVLAGVVLLAMAALNVCGRTVVQVSGNSGQIFVGVGSVGWTRHFNWAAVKAVDEYFYVPGPKGAQRVAISLISDHERLQFGTLVGADRREFLLQTLRRLLAARCATEGDSRWPAPQVS